MEEGKEGDQPETGDGRDDEQDVPEQSEIRSEADLDPDDTKNTAEENDAVVEKSESPVEPEGNDSGVEPTETTPQETKDGGELAPGNKKVKFAHPGKKVNSKKQQKPKWVVKKEPCTHAFCNPPKSDLSNYPKGFPWASGRLKCLPGYCKYRKSVDEEEKIIIETRAAEDAERLRREKIEKYRRRQKENEIDLAKEEVIYFLNTMYWADHKDLVGNFKKRRDEKKKGKNLSGEKAAGHKGQPQEGSLTTPEATTNSNAPTELDAPADATEPNNEEPKETDTEPNPAPELLVLESTGEDPKQTDTGPDEAIPDRTEREIGGEQPGQTGASPEPNPEVAFEAGSQTDLPGGNPPAPNPPENESQDPNVVEPPPEPEER